MVVCRDCVRACIAVLPLCGHQHNKEVYTHVCLLYPYTHTHTHTPHSCTQSNGAATSQSTVSSSTPQKASEVRKPRSHTVATDSPSSPPASTATSSAESTTTSEDAARSSSVSLSPDGDKTQLSSSMDGSKPLLPSRPPLLAKPKLLKGPPPPRPKPFVPTSTNQGMLPI